MRSAYKMQPLHKRLLTQACLLGYGKEYLCAQVWLFPTESHIYASYKWRRFPDLFKPILAELLSKVMVTRSHHFYIHDPSLLLIATLKIVRLCDKGNYLLKIHPAAKKEQKMSFQLDQFSDLTTHCAAVSLLGTDTEEAEGTPTALKKSWNCNLNRPNFQVP